MGMINLAIIGRNQIVREGLRRIVADSDFNVRAATAHVGELVDIAAEVGALHLIIIDTTSDDHGLESCLRLRESFPQSRLVLIAEDCALGAIVRALAAGADGYLFKAIASEPLISALRLVALGEKVVPSQTISAMIEHQFRDVGIEPKAEQDAANLSDREIEILGCLVQGDANKLISRRLSIAEATVKVHIKAILRKLNVSNRTQAAIWAVNCGIVGSSASDKPLRTGASRNAAPAVEARAAA